MDPTPFVLAGVGLVTLFFRSLWMLESHLGRIADTLDVLKAGLKALLEKGQTR